MLFNKKFLKIWIKNRSIVFNMTNVLILAAFITAFLFIYNNNIKIIEGNRLKDKGKDEEGAKEESAAPYAITNEVLPPADHVTEGRSVG